MREFRYAFRALRRTPGYTLTCVGVLALGIGANAAVFSVISSVVIHPLPYPHLGRLVFVWERFPGLPKPLDQRVNVRYENFDEWRRQNTVFEQMAAFAQRPLVETDLGHSKEVKAAFSTANLFPILAAEACVGRLFTAAEERAGDHVAVLSDDYFDRRFHSDAGALGKPIELSGAAYTVIGVLPPRFHLPSTMEGENQSKPDILVPLHGPDPHYPRDLLVPALLKPGASLARARAEMAGIADRLGKSKPDMDHGWTTSVFPFTVEDANPKLRQALYVLMSAVGFLLLIACANLANLTLARARMRTRDVAVRLALGAAPGRIVKQLAVEALLIAVSGAAAGLVLASWAVKLMLSLEPEDLQRPELIGIDLTVFLFAAGAAVVTALLFGLAPAISLSRLDLNGAMKNGGAWGGSAAGLRGRQFLVALETGLAVVLLTGAGLMIRSFRELTARGIGFDPTPLTIADIQLPEKRYPDDASRSRFFRELMDRTRANPDVRAVAVTDSVPLHSLSFANFHIAGRPDPVNAPPPIADVVSTTPAYFNTIGLGLEGGRLFTDADVNLNEAGKNSAVVINRAFARQFFPGENPIGQYLRDEKRSFEITGIVSDFRSFGLENPPRPTLFWPNLRMRNGSLVVRSSAARQTVAAVIRDSIRAIDRELESSQILPMEHWVDQWLSQRKFNTLLLAIFAGLALVLGMLGVYGVLSNLVTARVREIGIRMAIGASPWAIGRLVVRQSMAPVVLGIVAGLAAAAVLGRFLESLLFQVRPRDPMTLTLAACAILAMCPLAIYVPLRRAVSVDCTVALRQE